MSKTNFDKIGEFNKAFGVKEHKNPQQEIFKEDPKTIKYRVSLITEEYNELLEAVKNHDYVETVDALADIMYVVLGMGRAIGVDLQKAFDIVHDSNMSKLCVSEEEAKQTVEWYKQQYTEGKLKYDTPNYRKSDDGVHWVVFNESTSKILKSINYTPANFKSIITNKSVIKESFDTYSIDHINKYIIHCDKVSTPVETLKPLYIRYFEDKVKIRDERIYLEESEIGKQDFENRLYDFHRKMLIPLIRQCIHKYSMGSDSNFKRLGNVEELYIRTNQLLDYDTFCRTIPKLVIKHFSE